MTIAEKRKQYISLSNIIVGECFELNDDIYMKTDEMDDNRKNYLVVKLKYGVAIYLEKETKVTPINTELSILD